MICQECKMNVVPADAFHPYLHCVIWKAYHIDPERVLRDHSYTRKPAANRQGDEGQ